MGPLPFLRNQRYWVRFVVVLGVITFIYFTPKNKERKFAIFKEKIPFRLQKLDCSTVLLNEIKGLSNCVPKTCGRFVSDSLVSPKENDILLEMTKKIFIDDTKIGGITLYDLHRGLFTKEEYLTYRIVKSKIQHAIADTFGIVETSIHLTSPTFISRLTNKTVPSGHEYWIPHVDKIKYKTFHYTSIVYLNDFSRDFEGGRFIFIDGKDKNRTTSALEPKKGRTLLFTSGSENLHNVEKIVKGVRLAMTVSFTCNKNYAVEDPEVVKAVNVE